MNAGGVDDEIGEEKRTRGPGSRSPEHKRDNPVSDLRFAATRNPQNVFSQGRFSRPTAGAIACKEQVKNRDTGDCA